MLAFAAYSLVFSLISGNCSKVDQLWSIVPAVYAWMFYYHAEATHPDQSHGRLHLLCVLISLWAIRLTYNFYRRGKHIS